MLQVRRLACLLISADQSSKSFGRTSSDLLLLLSGNNFGQAQRELWQASGRISFPGGALVSAKSLTSYDPLLLSLQGSAGSVCHQIGKRRRAHQEQHPDARIVSLGIGDTTEPIPPSIARAMRDAAEGLGTLEGYSGCA